MIGRVRFLVMDRNPVTKALEPVIIHGRATLLLPGQGNPVDECDCPQMRRRLTQMKRATKGEIKQRSPSRPITDHPTSCRQKGLR